ncbi:hypothetical protein VF21_10082 [Pseudogymnoascus sp. 05NY08]|nr:hypothetical protein VF21_10082 [Pseudogymnoascus sp. 05NY08]
MSSASPKSPSLRGDPPRPAPLACTTCRRKHLKCDARQPICARCAKASLRCTYTPSRRGYSRPRSGRLGADRTEEQSASQPGASAIGVLFPIPSEVSGYSGSNRDETRTNTVEFYQTSNDVIPPQNAVSTASYRSPSILSSVDAKQLVELFYTYFYPAHPILLPKTLYFGRNYPSCVQHVVQFIGSHYSSSISGDQSRSAAAEELANGTQKTPCMVQGRLLFAIALHGRNETKHAQSMLAQAVCLAREIGMNQRNFATINGQQQIVEEESLRRTWWELYVVDGIMAGFWRKSEFNIHSFASDVLLPCEEATYMDAACLPDPPTVARFDNRLFEDDEMLFSSFCYRIEAARILARVLALSGARDVHQDQVQAIDNALAGWAHHLPPAKADIIDTFGEVDEILFQAHMIIQYASLFLHFPRSNLLSTLAATANIAGGQRNIHVSPSSTQHTHAIKAMEASKQLSNLAALRLPVQNHTPFFICGLVLGAVVQLSACSVHSGNCLEQHRDRVALIIGVLKSLGRTWAFSHVVLQQIKKVAAEVFNFSEIKSNGPQKAATHDSGIDMIVEENSWLDNFDIQTLQNMMPFNMDMIYNEPE